MHIYLAVTPDKQREALRFTERLAHVAYRVGPDGHLTRQSLLARTQGGLMVLGDRGCGPIRDCPALCREVWRECGNRNYTGVVADFERDLSPDRLAFLEMLSQVLRRNRRLLYVPEACGPQLDQAAVLVCTAISGGTFRQRLDAAAERFGPQRLALDLQRLRMEFPLPCPSGEGTPLTGAALRELMERRQPAVFYSRDLCAKYFTYTEQGKSHFVLFDDADTLSRKIQAGKEMDLAAAFLMYPEVEDLLPRLFPRPEPRQPGR